MKRNHPTYVKAKSIAQKIGHQFPTEVVDGKFHFKVVERAIMDLVHKKYREEAADYLRQQPIPEAELCGVDSEWIRRQIVQAELYDFGEEK